MPHHQSVSAVESTPFIYRLILLTIEPLFATGGVIQACLKPAMYTDMMTRGTVHFNTDNLFLYTQLTGGWLYFAFIEAVVLRSYDDLRLWRLLCMGMLLSDLMFCIGTIQAVGGLANWATLAKWTPDDMLVFVTTAPMVVVRVLIVLGIGIKPVNSSLDEAKRE